MSEAGRPRVFAVLGMHRSGTSWLAGTLEALGVELGDVNEASPYNERGNRENQRILDLHARVFAESGGSWIEPPRAVQWSDESRRELRAIVDEMDAAHGHWGFKDPRALFVIDQWHHVLGDRLHLVGIYRHPRAVARSLASRGAMSVDERTGLAAWKRYNEQLLDVHASWTAAGGSLPVVSFDSPPAALIETVGVIARAWDLPRADRAGDFFDASLVHNDAEADGRVPWSCRKVWRRLQACSAAMT